MAELRSQFRPEFLNRVDEIVLFKPLTLADLTKIVDLQIRDFSRRLAGQGLSLEITPEAEALLGREGYDPVYGARPLKRMIQQKVETPVARRMVGGEYADGDKVRISVKGDALDIS